MSGHPHWRGQTPAEPGRSGFAGASETRPVRPGTRSRRGLVVFALALTVALGTVLMMIAATSVQAVAESSMFNDPKADGWVGMAAVGSVLACALVGTIAVYRYSTRRPR